jgi:hypothetical protein
MPPAIQNIAVLAAGDAGLVTAFASLSLLGLFYAAARPNRDFGTQSHGGSHPSLNDAFAEHTALRLRTEP